MHLGNPLHLLDGERLEQLSRDAAAAAAELNGLRAALLARAAGLHWHSTGSHAFQAALQDLLLQLWHCGSRLTELAGALREHRQRAASRAASLGSAAALAASPVAAAQRLVRLP